MAQNSKKTDARISARLRPDLAKRVQTVRLKSRRTKTDILEECLEKALPTVEKRYLAAA